jgi:uncharacterized protein (DUF2126 family)/transglutaminase-like putative cysteine protease
MKIALEHRTTYRFDRPIAIGPHVIRLRPAPHARTPIEAYSLTISPADHFLNWQQDPFGNHLARAVFPSKSSELDIAVGMVADMRVINPFDFFIEEYAETFPFSYPADLAADLKPYLDIPAAAQGPVFAEWATGNGFPTGDGQSTVQFLADLNAAVHRDVAYSVRMEQGVQAPDETLTRQVGSCRDSGWLLAIALRHCGLAARFVSGYLVQLAADQPSLDGPSGPTEDFTDLHAWAEVYIPGAGWIGLDPTSALFAGEGHIPLAATPQPSSAAAITGATEASETRMEFANKIWRVQHEPRSTLPYSTDQVADIQRLGEAVDQRLQAAGLELTMGGEPTFVSADDMTSAQWTVAADGPEKRTMANRLAAALADRYAKGGLVQRGEGKWYPGEPQPRWQISLIWRSDGEQLWRDPALLADPSNAAQADPDAAAAAEQLAKTITADFGLPADQLQPAFEDPLARLAAEVGQPIGPRPTVDPERPGTELVSELDRAAAVAAAWVLPLIPSWFVDGWASPAWRTRRGRLVLVPGESPAGSRLPLDALDWVDPSYAGEDSYLRAEPPLSNGEAPRAVVVDPREARARTALVLQARDGFVHVFLPPLERLEKFLELVRLIDGAATQTHTSVILEGYGPPPDPRIKLMSITPDPGVIEVNVHPTASWAELSELTATLYEIARKQRLCAETFALDGRHSGTGGGNHITLGGPEPMRSPLLRRPDLLVSMITYWQHHPSLSYLFAGRFVGPTSQAPRVDEGRPETLYELEISFAELEALADTEHRPWAIDRALRPLLTDITGNTHRAEFCIDKLYNPDSLRGRLGLLELRGFEMPPHPDMALVQALLVRALIARFAEEPYSAPLVRWGSALHERFLLPHFILADMAEVVADLVAHDFEFDLSWLLPFVEFRFPRIGVTNVSGVELELRSAIEPWHVLGEEATAGGVARYVDSSTERLQVAVTNFVPERQLLTCNGRPVPLTGTGTPGSFVVGVRYKAWKPWSALHPTLDVDSPLVFDLIDRASRISLGGATYHVVHPGGRAYEHPPVNSFEAEARRQKRFEAMGHTTGVIDIAALDAELIRRAASGDEYQLTLDMRRRVPPGWGLGGSPLGDGGR